MATIKSDLFRVWKARELESGHSITYKEIAEQTGISTATLYNYRVGKVQRFEAKTLAGLCAYFDCHPGDLLVYTPNAPESTPTG